MNKNRKIELNKINISSKKRVDFELRTESLDGDSIFEILSFINALHKKYPKVNMPILFNFRNSSVSDKLTYVLFECICDYLIRDCNHSVKVIWDPDLIISTQGVKYSPLTLLAQKEWDKELFYKKFTKDISRKHFRRMMYADAEKVEVSVLYTDLASFFKGCNIEETIDEVIEAITEIVGNAIEHGMSDCLLDIDVAEGYKKKDDNQTENEYVGINIAVVNFSDKILGADIKKKILVNCLSYDGNRYGKVKEAYDFHKDKFNNNYTEEDFWNVVALQDRVSGRFDTDLKTGGLGMTTLVNSIQKKCEADSCYVLSGDRVLFFKKDVLNYDENTWIGFNNSNDFFGNIPDEDVYDTCTTYMPGTAYNLNFVIKQRKEDYI